MMINVAGFAKMSLKDGQVFYYKQVFHEGALRGL